MVEPFAQFGLPLVADDGTQFQSSTPFIDFNYTGSLQTHLVTYPQIGRLDIIAAIWWAGLPDASQYADLIAHYNNIDDQIGEVTLGRVLLIPVDARYDSRSIQPWTYYPRD